MNKRRKIELTTIESLKYYKLPMILALLSLVLALIYSFNFQNQKFIFFFICTVVITSITIYHFIKQSKRLYYYSFKSSDSSYNFKKLINSIYIELDCSKISISKNKAILYRPQDYLNGGEDIFIIKENNTIYINSIKSIKFPSSSYSKKRNKENIITVLQNLESLIKGQYLKEQRKLRKEKKENQFWNESEWTLKKILMRLLMYPFTISVLFFFIFFLIKIYNDYQTSSLNYRFLIEGVLYLIYLAIIVKLFIKSDIKILLKKRKLNQKNSLNETII